MSGVDLALQLSFSDLAVTIGTALALASILVSVRSLFSVTNHRIESRVESYIDAYYRVSNQPASDQQIQIIRADKEGYLIWRPVAAILGEGLNEDEVSDHSETYVRANLDQAAYIQFLSYLTREAPGLVDDISRVEALLQFYPRQVSGEMTKGTKFVLAHTTAPNNERGNRASSPRIELMTHVLEDLEDEVPQPE